MSDLTVGLSIFAGLYQFQSPLHLAVALTHKSFANEQRAEPAVEERTVDEHNERYEFLGDSVLNMVLSARLMRDLPNESEGGLSKRRASLVNEERLADLARHLGLASRLKLGKGEIKTGGAMKPRILACGLEAMLGAIFLDGGFLEVDRVINAIFAEELAKIAESSIDFERDYKTRLQEWAHGKNKTTPHYIVKDEFGPAHSRGFRIAVHLGEEELGEGMGKSKKAAEQDAAKQALAKILEKTAEKPADKLAEKLGETK